MRRLSVVITNHSYEQYHGMAIKGALDVRWDDVEVVVVDDGSAEGSPICLHAWPGPGRRR